MRQLSFAAIALFCGALAGSACEEGLEPVPFQGVSGRISFLGRPPANTEWVRLVVYREIPAAEAGFFPPNLVLFSDPLPLDSAADFVLPLAPGTYRWLPAVWKEEGLPLSAESLRVLGWYTAGEGFDAPAALTVSAEVESAGIEIVADFRTLLTVDEVLALLGGSR